MATSIDLAISLYASATASHAMAGEAGVTTAIAQNAAGFETIAWTLVKIGVEGEGIYS